MTSNRTIKSPWRAGSHHSVGACFILLLASLCANAQTQGQPASATVELKTGSINGRVVTESGQPLVNVSVWVRPVGSQDPPVATTTTNRDGIFKVTGLERGSYTVNAAVPSYIPKVRYSVPTVGESVTLVLLKGGVVTGIVTNSKGEPVVGIGVRVQMVRDESDREVPGGMNYENVTDDRGVYRVYGVPSGTYVVAADGNAAHTVYSRFNVNAFANDVPTYAPSSNREAADRISVRAGEETSGVDIRYRGERGSVISGIVSGFGNERGSWVTLTSLAEKGPRFNTYFEANREFVFEGIADGDYLLEGNTSGDGRNRGITESLVLNVRGADIEGLNLTAARLGAINGRVVLEPLKTIPPECTEKPEPQLSEILVTAWHRVIQGDKKKPQFVWRANTSGKPNAQGNLTLSDLPANEYYFAVRFSGPQWYLRSIAFPPPTPNGAPVDATRTWTTVKPGDQLSGLTFALAQGASLVRGRVPLAEGQSVPEKLVAFLVPVERENAEEPLHYFAAPVSAEGYFWVHHVAPGRYWGVARPATENTRENWSKLRLPDGAEIRSSLRHDAQQSKTEIEIKPCQDVEFRLPL